MKHAVLFCIMLLLALALPAQINQYYTFSASTATYTPITGTSVPSAVGDDVISTPIDIGFTFVYGISPYTQVKVASNGYVTLGTNPGSTLSNQLSSTSFCPVLAPLWDDTGYATVIYLLSGTAPNRIFTIQYTAMKWNYSSQTSFNMQVKLYETSLVEFIYDATASTPMNASASIGINMLPGDVNNYYSITPGAQPTASTTGENTNITQWPGANVVYTFSPPIPTPNDMSALSVSGNTTPSVGTTSNYTVTIRNFGTSAQSAYSVKLMSGTTELASVAGPTIQPSTNATVTIPWSPTATGLMQLSAKTVLAGDENPVNDQSQYINISVQAAGTLVITVGDGSQSARMPVDTYVYSSLFETIYQAAELNLVGMITGLNFYNTFTGAVTNLPVKIWLGSTAQTGLSNGWIPSTQMTQVFDGTVNFPTGQNTINITLPVPFLYVEGNLVMMVQRPMGTSIGMWDNFFLCQTVGSNRTLMIGDYQTNYDPTSPPANATNSGTFPRTGFLYIPGGVGHLSGTVYGAGNQPLPNTNIQILNGALITTDAAGHYSLSNVINGNYSVTASRYGYYSSTQNMTITEGQTTVLNFTLTQMPTVTVTGRITGSDAPAVGLPAATLLLTGYENYEVTANATGVFTIPGVYENQTYAYLASAQGYRNLTGNIAVGTVDYNAGNIVLSEIAYSPRNVTATLTAEQEAVNLNWLAPDPTSVDVTQSFESPIFPPAQWTRTVTNNEPPNTSGVYPTWCRFGSVTVADVVVPPSVGEWQAGFWWNFNHQDEWLITPQFNCPQGAVLSFDSNVFLGSINGDHYYVKASADNGATWTVLWDASALTGGWNHYATPIVIDLGEFTGQQIKLAWHADDNNAGSDGMWYVWFIDNVVVANTDAEIRFAVDELRVTQDADAAGRGIVEQDADPAATRVFSSDSALSFSRDAAVGLCVGVCKTPHITDYKSVLRDSKINLAVREDDRALTGYQIWRLPQGQEQNETVWTLLTPAAITTLDYADAAWQAQPAGTYKWAVKAIYTNGVSSLAMFSNALIKLPVVQGQILGLVTNPDTSPIGGAVVTAGGQTCVTSVEYGSYMLSLPSGIYSVTCSATSYDTQTRDDIVVVLGQITELNFVMVSTAAEDDMAVTATALKANFPNPFRSETTLNFDVKDTAPVRIDIYNAKGQLIRTLLNAVKAGGHHSLVWNGKDRHGNAVASGVYTYRLQSGKYVQTRRMMVMK